VGRTVPTFRMILEHVIGDWRTFRRALHIHDRTAYDNMMTHGRQHAAAASNAARLNPTEALFMAILLEHEKELVALKRKHQHQKQPMGLEDEGEESDTASEK
jgi:hypothetical protein